jgi:hypothetical protein
VAVPHDHIGPTLGYGEIHVRSAPEDFPPPPINLGVAVVDVVHSRVRTCALGVDGFVRCFGWGPHLGQGIADAAEVGETIEPPPITDLGGPVVQLSDSAFSGATCALGEDGKVRCFGSQRVGGEWSIVGDEPGEMPPAPLPLGDEPIEKIVHGQHQICALTDVGHVLCWQGWETTFGYGPSDDVIGDALGELPPPPVQLGGPAVDLHGSSGQFCAILEDGSVECWGEGLFGYESNEGPPFTPTGLTIGDEPGEMPPPALRLYE